MRRHGLVVGLLLLAAALAAFDTASTTGRRMVEALRSSTATVVGPVQIAARAAVRPVEELVASVSTWGSDRAEIRRLRAANLALTVENMHARSALLLARRPGHSAVGDSVEARVIGLGPLGSFAWTATIDVGRRHDVHPGAGVLAAGGLVGRVLRTGEETSTVLLVCDARSTVGARVRGSDELGMVHGEGAGPLTLTLIDPTARVEVGAPVVTWGSPKERPYPPDVPIGRVTKVERDSAGGIVAEVRTTVDLTTLGHVTVRRGRA